MVAVDARYRTWLREAEQWTSEIVGVSPQAVELSEFLYAELLAWLRGEQLEILLRGAEGNGFKGWRTLVREQEQLEPARKVEQLERLLHPDFNDGGNWRRSWLHWEAEVARHAALLGGVLTGDVKIGLVRQRTATNI